MEEIVPKCGHISMLQSARHCTGENYQSELWRRKGIFDFMAQNRVIAKLDCLKIENVEKTR